MSAPSRAAALAACAVLIGILVGCNAASPPPVVHDSVDRGSWQMPDEVVAALKIDPGSRIADIGAGSGYFTFRLAQATGPQGKVFAVDLDPSSLVRLRYGARRLNLTNIQTVVGQATSSRLPARSVDLIFMSNTYHHIDDPVTYFSALRRSLRPGARVVIVDLDRKAFSRRTTPHAVARSLILEEMKIAGFRLQTEHRFLPKQSFLEFMVAGQSTSASQAPHPVRLRRNGQ